MKKLIGLILLLALFVGCSLVQGDTVSVTLTWTAPGDDGMVGTCSYYKLRWDTDSTRMVNAAVPHGVLLSSPQPANSTEEYTVTGLDGETVYFFAIIATDEAGNNSPMSNILRLTTPDGDEPAAITDLRVQ